MEEPDRDRRRDHRRPQRLHRALRQVHLEVDPDRLVATRLQDPSWAHPLGTDELGRDTLARIIHGAQVSLQVGIISVGIALLLGVSIGLLSGFFTGKVDTVLMRFVDLMFALPGSCSRS